MAHLPDAIARLAESYIIDRVNAERIGASGHWEMIAQLPDHEIDSAFHGACADGSIPLINALFSRGAKRYIAGIQNASSHGHVDAIVHILNMSGGGQSCDWVNALVASNSMATFRAISALRPNVELSEANFDALLSKGCRARDFSMVAYAIAHGATNYDSGLYEACEGGDRGIISLMLHQGGRPDDGLYGACRHGNAQVTRDMIRRGAQSFRSGFMIACYNKHVNIMDMMFGSPDIQDIPDLKEIIGMACWMGGLPLYNWIMAKGVVTCACGKPMAHHLAAAEARQHIEDHAHDA